jgi:hypothetical protein
MQLPCTTVDKTGDEKTQKGTHEQQGPELHCDDFKGDVQFHRQRPGGPQFHRALNQNAGLLVERDRIDQPDRRLPKHAAAQRRSGEGTPGSPSFTRIELRIFPLRRLYVSMVPARGDNTGVSSAAPTSKFTSCVCCGTSHT